MKRLDSLILAGEPEEIEIGTQDRTKHVNDIKGKKTASSYELPIRVKIHTKMDATGIRINYGKGNIQFSQGCVRMHGIAEGWSEGIQKCEGIPIGKFAEIEWTIDKELMAVRVDNGLRYISNNLAHVKMFKESPEFILSSPVEIVTPAGSLATVERLRMAEEG